MQDSCFSYKAILSCFFLFFIVSTVVGQSAEQKKLEKRRESLKQEMAQLQRLRDTNKKKEISILTQVEDLDTKIKLRTDLIKVTNRQANLLTREINENLSKMESLREELTILKEDYGEMIRKSYKSKSGQSKIMFLLSSESFKQAYKRTQYMKQYANYRKKQGNQIKERTKLLQQTNKKLVQQKKDKDVLIAENRIAKAALDKEKQRQAALVREIKKKSSSYTAQLRKKQRETDRIDHQIDKIIADAIKASNKKAGKSTTSNKGFALTPAEVTLARKFSRNKGKLIWPVERGRVTRRFGKSAHPTLPGITTINSGVEIETSQGASARAVFAGEVTTIQDMQGGAATVFIRHGDYFTVYTNLKNIKVKTGDQIAYKETLGEITRNAFSGKTILKFSVRRNTSKLNPADWVLGM
ncbi:murein hydrolase activator EnvC family protein [Dokdonia sp. Hel_I_53]|uniref:murein hydrolase activator EnvC family protein n=1 Tax=Dokdonia sp. Hel_I_53 TaxID=1566287 RepID=UPI00119AF4B7|nr:peptidoglycan DD-metalloendopeptidase family protein [Dokdonia sp. Hel_I_53]TVZ52738.1 septal ring factor EnvC (AmiA/AmiB activator) [Dokdonia sp. Hel_I_53]